MRRRTSPLKESAALIAYIRKHGKEYEPAFLPRGLDRGELGSCFDNTIERAIAHRELRYVEGIALMTEGHWALHAWLTDGTRAFDVTWHWRVFGIDLPHPGPYIGMELDTRKVAQIMRASGGYQGILANGWRTPELARELLPAGYPMHRAMVRTLLWLGWAKLVGWK